MKFKPRAIKRSSDLATQFISDLMYHIDPCGCTAPGSPADEYMNEASAIVKKLRDCPVISPERAELIVKTILADSFTIVGYPELRVFAETCAWIVENPQQASELFRKL